VTLAAVLSLGTQECNLVPDECLVDDDACVVVRKGDPIRIGVGAPLSEPYAVYGTEVAQAVQLALGEAPGVCGHPYEMDARDDGGDQYAEIPAGEFAADGKTLAVVGHMFSGGTAAALPIYEEARIPIVSPASTRIDLSQLGYDAFNRVIPSDLYQADRIALALADLNVSALAIMHDGGDFGSALAARVADLYLPQTPVIVKVITPGLEDYSGALGEVAESEPDAVFFAGYDREMAALLNQRETAGLADIYWLGTDGVFGDVVLQRAGANAEGLYATAPADPPPSAALDAFYAAWDAAYEPEDGLQKPGTPYAVFAYDAANVIIAAVEEAAIPVGSALVIPREAMIENIRATSGFPGITGEITCDTAGECSQAGGYALYQVNRGAWELLD